MAGVAEKDKTGETAAMAKGEETAATEVMGGCYTALEMLAEEATVGTAKREEEVVTLVETEMAAMVET